MSPDLPSITSNNTMAVSQIFPELLNENSCPELIALRGVEQNPAYHPEGDAYVHTLLVYQEAQAIATRDNLSELDASILCLAAVCHDFGKATHTFWDNTKASWTSPGHDAAGEAPTRAFLTRLGVQPEYQERIVALVLNHMAHTYLEKGKKPSKKAAAGLLERIQGKTTLEELQRLVEADKSGRPPLPKHVPETFLLLAEVCREVQEEQRLKALEPAPLVTGKDLLEIGYQPGKELGLALAAVARWQKEGQISTKEEALFFLKGMVLKD